MTSGMMIEIDKSQSHIFLVGFMACGKSTVGPLLAMALGRPFVDLDCEIESMAGSTIADLIAKDGEESFRVIESAMLREMTTRPSSVIAPGGGAITRAENLDLMLRAGLMIWLDAPFELCWSRIKQDAVVRPLAHSEDAAHSRYLSRLPFYRSAALHVPVIFGQSPQAIVESIQHMLAIGR